jgi:hypothetical protein
MASFAEEMRAIARKNREEFERKQAEEDALVIPPFVERVKEKVRAHVKTPCCQPSLEISNFEPLDLRQRIRAKMTLESAPINLKIRPDFHDGRDFWVVMWHE